MTANVLIVDDHPENIDLLFTILHKAGYRVIVADSGNRALDLIKKNQPDVILLDINMPDIDGFQICRMLRANPSTEQTPIIFVTGRENDIATGFEVGGNDYVSKPFKHAEILSRVEHQLERQRLQQELQTLNQELDSLVKERTAQLVIANRQLREEVNERRFMQDRLHYLADHDFVTHLHNRSALDRHVSELIALVQTESITGWFLQFELHGFRLVNETNSFIAGDEVLSDIGEILTTCAGKDAFVARISGDRFALVLRAKPQAFIDTLTNQILAQVDQYRYQREGREFSFGGRLAAVKIDRDINSLETLLIMAEETAVQLRQANQSHGHYTPAINKINDNEKDWPLKIFDALKNNHFRVFVQRIVARDGDEEKIKLEALIRLWDDDQGRLLTPSSFMPAVKRFQLIPEIDRWVIAQVCQFFGQHPNLQQKIVNIAVNLSANTLSDTSIVSYVQQCLEQYQMPPKLLAFEITETERIQHVTLAANTIAQLSELGCTIAIDDFGSGYASYNYIHNIEFDTLKVDGLFVRDILNQPDNQILTKSFVDISNQLNKTLVAECVEDEPTRQYLASLGVDWMQGYLFHRPEELTEDCLNRLIQQL